MRVHDTRTCDLQDERTKSEPYAILSHTWDGNNEQSFGDVKWIQKYIRPRIIHSLLVIVLSSLLGFLLADVVGAHLSDIPPYSADAGAQLYARVFHVGICVAPVLHICLRWLVKKAESVLSQRVLNRFRLSEKIRMACAIAHDNKFTQIWVDISCIDRTSSSELSQAINSMFAWYRDAAVCYVYLPDVPSSSDHRHPGSAFRYSRWFTRGWTLQELIAPRVVVFFSREWKEIGTKESLADIITDITGIDRDVLLNKKLPHEVSVATRMSWAAERSTTLVEDQAYSLLGIFGIVMTPIYGEGLNAFRRLQEEILSHIRDDSIFVWESHVFKTPHISSPQSASTSSGATRARAHLMRLLDTATGQFVDLPESSKTPYAVISHTWNSDGPELKYEDILEMQPSTGARLSYTMLQWSLSTLLFFLRPVTSALGRTPISIFTFRLRGWVDHSGSALKLRCLSILNNPHMSHKIRKACAAALRDGLTLLWIDSGCVDYGDRSELRRTVASVYSWFSGAAVCYVYLIDVLAADDPRAAKSQFRSSRWFTRCWTLQELVGPKDVIFLSREWEVIGTKEDLVDVIADITGISRDVLLHRKPLSEVSVMERISWASERTSSLVEDHAYSLLGILDITLTPQYGEGEWAFRRLQEKIRRRNPQETLRFPEWPILHRITTARPERGYTPLDKTPHTLLAPSVRAFRFSGNIRSIPGGVDFRRNYPNLSNNGVSIPRHEYGPSPHGIRSHLHVLNISESSEWCLVILSCEDSSLQDQDHLLARLCYALPEPNSSDMNLRVGELFTQGSSALGALAVTWSRQESLVRVPKPQHFSSSPFKNRPTVKSIYIPHKSYSPNFGLKTDWFGLKPPKATTIMIEHSTKAALLSLGCSVEYANYSILEAPDTISLSCSYLPLILRLKKDDHEAAIFFPVCAHPHLGYDSGWIVDDDDDDDGRKERLPCGVVTSTQSGFASLARTGHSQTAQKRLLKDLKRYCASQQEWNTGTTIVRPTLIRIADGHYDLRFDIDEVPVQVPVN